MKYLKFPITPITLAADKKDLANYLNYEYKDFCWILYAQPIHKRYFEIKNQEKLELFMLLTLI